jgi:hypothetical protein
LAASSYARVEEVVPREARAAFAALGLKPSADTLALTRSDVSALEPPRPAA